MSVVRANITNTYQTAESTAVRSQQVGEAKPGDSIDATRGSGKEQEASRNLKVRRDGANNSPGVATAKPEQADGALTLPVDPNQNSHRIVHSGDWEHGDDDVSYASTELTSEFDKTRAAKDRFRKADRAESELRNSDTANELDHESQVRKERSNSIRAKADAEREPFLQPKPLSILEQFMLKMRDQVMARNAENNEDLLNKPSGEDRGEIASSEASSTETAQGSESGGQADLDMFLVRRRIHDDFLSSLQERVAASAKATDFTQRQKSELDSKQQLPAEQKPIAQRPVYEALAQPEPIDQEAFVNKLKLALIPEMREVEEVAPEEFEKGTKMLEHLQNEGVFGLSPHGRYHSVTDFIRNKGFEYELEQRPFTDDEFLRETETAIYDILNRGNSSSVAKSLLQAAESVNKFRNHMIRSSEGAAVDADIATVTNSIDIPRPSLAQRTQY